MIKDSAQSNNGAHLNGHRNNGHQLADEIGENQVGTS